MFGPASGPSVLAFLHPGVIIAESATTSTSSRIARVHHEATRFAFVLFLTFARVAVGCGSSRAATPRKSSSTAVVARAPGGGRSENGGSCPATRRKI